MGGVLADNACIIRPAGTDGGSAEEIVELFLEDSKTGFSRYVDFWDVEVSFGFRALRRSETSGRRAGRRSRRRSKTG